MFIAPPSQAQADCRTWNPELVSTNTQIIRIDIDNQNIFNNQIEAENKAFHRLANKLRIKTKSRVVKRQLLFKVGDPLDLRVLKETERNLRSKAFIKGAEVHPSLQCDDGVVVTVTTKDNWTLQPGVSFGVAGGKSKYSFELQEKNLFGLGKSIDLEYIKGLIRNESSIEYYDPNLFASTKRLRLGYQNNSDGNRSHFNLQEPFYALTTKRAWEVDLSDATLINPIYRRGEIVNEIGQNRKLFTVDNSWLFKHNQNNYQRLTVGVTLDDNTFFNSDDYGQAELPAARDYKYPWLAYEFIQEDFIERTNFNSMGRIEDVSLGHHLTAKLGQDFSHSDTFFDVNYSKGYALNTKNLVTLNTYLSGIHNSDGLVNTHWGFKTDWHYFQSDDKTFYASTQLDKGTNLYPEQPQYLGGETGLRGYPFRYLKGDNVWLTTLEQRFFYHWYPLRTFQFASAIFVDTGSAWSSGQSKEIFTNVGIGFRLIPTRTSGGQVIHFDLAVPTSSNADLDSVQFQISAKRSF